MVDNPLLDDVTRALRTIEPERGSGFAVRRFVSAAGVELSVEGAGKARFPISAIYARKLRKVARKAPFGLRDKTLIDARIRDTWQIAKRRVRLDKSKLARMLEPELSAIQRELGLPAEGKLVAELYKLLLYEPGQFFVPHQDSEKHGDMIGTLLMELPSACTGGTVVVEHRGEKRTFRRTKRSSDAISLLAFYADCHHEVKPIRSGHRVVLTFHLRFSEAGMPAGVASAKDIARVTAAVDAYLRTPAPASPYGQRPPEEPERLVYLLDHAYSQHSLAWGRLKNADRPRAVALADVAERLDCVCHLALADVHEHWGCEGDGGYRRRGRGRYDWYDEWDEPSEPGEPVLTELIETEIDLRHWVGGSGEPDPQMGPVGIDVSEVAFTKPSVELDPFKSEHEGWMGNWGNTVDRWYHRAAVVLWPRDRDFVLRARNSPAWALDRLHERIADGDANGARRAARELQPAWRRAVGSFGGAELFASTVHLARALDDDELGAELLEPFALAHLDESCVHACISLLEHYGYDWLGRVATAWLANARHNERAWLAVLPRLCQELHASGVPGAAELVAWLLDEATAAIAKRGAELARSVRGSFVDEEIPELAAEAALVMEAAASVGRRKTTDRLTELFTTGETALTPARGGLFLRALRDGRTPKQTRTLGLGALYDYIVDVVDRAVAAPARAHGDWAIDPPMRCSCDLCAELAEFLREPDTVSLEWPLAKQKRKHIHRQLDGYELPVRHTTRRSGSPHKLILNKLPTLFTDESERRKQLRQLLTWLRKERRAFS